MAVKIVVVTARFSTEHPAIIPSKNIIGTKNFLSSSLKLFASLRLYGNKKIKAGTADQR